MEGREAKILSLEVCPQRFGFAVFDGTAGLIDWGTTNYRGIGARRLAILRERTATLLKLHSPTHLVLRRRNSSIAKADKKTRSAVEVIRVAAKQYGLRVHSMSTDEVTRFFSSHDSQTKHQIASRIALWFTELSARLPRARKSWQSERHNMVVFDAVASGIAFFACERNDRQELEDAI